MNEPGLVTISMNELRRVKIIEAVVEGRLSGVRAAEQLGLSERQVSRLRRRFEGSGAAGLVSAKRGRPSNRQLPMNLRGRVIAIIRERYADFGPTLAREKLVECHGCWRRRKSDTRRRRKVELNTRACPAGVAARGMRKARSEPALDVVDVGIGGR